MDTPTEEAISKADALRWALSEHERRSHGQPDPDLMDEQCADEVAALYETVRHQAWLLRPTERRRTQ